MMNGGGEKHEEEKEELKKRQEEGKEERTKSPLARSHPTTTSTPSLFKNSSISPVPSTTAPSVELLTKGDRVGRAVRDTSGFRDWI